MGGRYSVNALQGIPAAKNPGVTFAFIEVTPVIAAGWLKLNQKNRKLKEKTVEAYALDMPF